MCLCLICVVSNFKYVKQRTIIKMEIFFEMNYSCQHISFETRPHSLTLSITITDMRRNKISQSHMRYIQEYFTWQLNGVECKIKPTKNVKKKKRLTQQCIWKCVRSPWLCLCSRIATTNAHTYKNFTSFFRVMNMKHYHHHLYVRAVFAHKWSTIEWNVSHDSALLTWWWK